jgi:hypothetical protein
MTCVSRNCVARIAASNSDSSAENNGLFARAKVSLKWCCHSRPRSFVVEVGQKFTEMSAAPTDHTATQCILTRLELDPFLTSSVNKHTRRAKRWPFLITLACSDSLRAGRSRDRIPMTARFSVPVLTRSGANPASYTTDTESLYYGLTGQRVALTNYSNLELRLKNEYSYASTPPLGLHGLSQSKFYLCVLYVRP